MTKQPNCFIIAQFTSETVLICFDILNVQQVPEELVLKFLAPCIK